MAHRKDTKALALGDHIQKFGYPKGNEKDTANHRQIKVMLVAFDLHRETSKSQDGSHKIRPRRSDLFCRHLSSDDDQKTERKKEEKRGSSSQEKSRHRKTIVIYAGASSDVMKNLVLTKTK